MGKGDSNINYPAQPSYGEGMADALKAQVELLTGTGDFSSTGSLESLLPLEESIRKKTAQTDTDILRQTLLGGEDAEYTQDGKILEGYDYVADGESKTGFSIEPIINVSSKKNKIGGSAVAPIPYPGGLTGEVGFILKDLDGNEIKRSVETIDTTYNSPQEAQAGMEANKDPKNLLKQAHQVTRNEFKEILTESQITEAFSAEDLSSLQFTDRGDTENATPRFKKNPDGTDFVAEAGTFTPGEKIRTGDGMVDLLGDKRGVQNTVAKEVTKTKGGYSWTGLGAEDAGREYYSTFDDEGNELRTGLSLAEAKKQSGDKRATSTTETVYEQADAGREAGFDESGNFLGLSAFGEDIQAGNLSRQRERDLQDVARLSGTYQDIMEDYKPGTQEALESARAVLESQEESLTGAGAIGGPQGITDPLSLTSKGFNAAQNTTAVDLTGDTSFTGAEVADPTKLTAETSYTPSTGVAGTGYTATAGLDGGQILQNDPVRAALMKDAEAALGQGLTDREERQIAEAARARSTMMGRTFDQSGAVAEAQARVAEDNQRKMQNRAFAQSALGQEAGFQESDLGRALQAGIQNQAAKNRAGEFTAGQDMQAQLANQQATNRASEFGVQAGLGQEQLSANMAQQKAMADAGFTQQARATALEAGLTQEQAEAQLNQQRLMANQQFSQQANKYGAQEDMQVQLNNLANQISNYQFETGSQMDADRLNEQLTQSGILGYIQAAGGLAALEDSSTLDPFQAVLGRGGGGSLQAGQSVFGQAGYGLNSGPAYLNPESGLGYIQNQATNAANMYNAQVGADATRTAGIYSAIGSLGGGLLGNSGLFGGE